MFGTSSESGLFRQKRLFDKIVDCSLFWRLWRGRKCSHHAVFIRTVMPICRPPRTRSGPCRLSLNALVRALFELESQFSFQDRYYTIVVSIFRNRVGSSVLIETILCTKLLHSVSIMMDITFSRNGKHTAWMDKYFPSFPILWHGTTKNTILTERNLIPGVYSISPYTSP